MKGNVPKGKILVTLVEVKEKTVGGVILPATQIPQKEGIVEIGGEQTKAGDIVHFMSALKLVIDEKDYFLLKESEVLYIE